MHAQNICGCQEMLEESFSYVSQGSELQLELIACKAQLEWNTGPHRKPA